MRKGGSQVVLHLKLWRHQNVLHQSVLTVKLLAILEPDVLHAILNSFNGNTRLLVVGDSLSF